MCDATHPMSYGLVLIDVTEVPKNIVYIPDCFLLLVVIPYPEVCVYESVGISRNEI